MIETMQVTHSQMIAGLQKETADLRHGRGFVRESIGRKYL